MSFYLRELTHSVAPARDQVDWEECGCPLCGNANCSPLVEAPDRTPGGSGMWFMVVQCHECGLCYTNPRPSQASMGLFYRGDYAPHQVLDERRLKRSHWWHRLPLMRNRQDRLRRQMPRHGERRLLDFGCGSGSFLLRMRGQGWRVTGLDMSEAAVSRLRGDFGLHALCGSLPHPALEDGSFDVITMWQSLEHVHQPLEALLAAKQLLAPGGKLIAAVPNIDSLAFRMFGSAWNGLDLPRHLVHFTPHTLSLMLRRAGFRVGRIGMVRRGGWLRGSARLATRQSAHRHSRWFHLLEGKAMSNFASWYGYWTGQADCLLAIATRR